MNYFENYRKLFQSGAFSQEVVPISVQVPRKPDLVVSQDEEFKKLLEDKAGIFFRFMLIFGILYFSYYRFFWTKNLLKELYNILPS